MFTAKHIKIIIRAKAASSSPGMLQGAHEAFGFICNKYLERVFRLKHSVNLLFVRISFSLLGVKQPEGSSKYIYKINCRKYILTAHLSHGNPGKTSLWHTNMADSATRTLFSVQFLH